MTTREATDVVVEVRDLRKSYGPTRALDGVTFAVRRGEVFGLLGTNGAGKTTTVEVLVGLRTADSGTASVLGLDPRHHHDHLVRKVGVQLQEAALPDAMTVGEALRLHASFHDTPTDVDRLLDDWDLRDVVRRRFKRLSGGQKQRLMIALALVGDPELVVLDELTTGLDPHARRATWAHVERLRDKGITVLLVTHLMDEAERLCDRVAVVHAGRVVRVGTPDELAAALDDDQTVRFAQDPGVDLDALRALPGVRAARTVGADVVVDGDADVLVTVVTHLAARGVRPRRFRTEQRGLEDAFLALTGAAGAPVPATVTEGEHA
ncbi:ABC transporter ATP-binding protein [Thalassiella azotivora]